LSVPLPHCGGTSQALRQHHIRAGVQLLRVEALPPLAASIGFREFRGIVADACERALPVITVCRLEPMPGVSGVVTDAEAQSVSSSYLGPPSHEVLARPDVDCVPRMMLRIEGIEVVVVIGERDEVLRAGCLV